MSITLSSQGTNLVVVKDGVSKTYPKGDVVTLLNDPFLELTYNHESVFKIDDHNLVEEPASTSMVDLQNIILDLLDLTGSEGSQGGGITSESDPTVPQHVKDLTTDQIANWEVAFTDHHTHANKTVLDQLTGQHLTDIGANTTAITNLKAGSTETVASLKALIDGLNTGKASATTVNTILTILGVDSSGNAVVDADAVVDTLSEMLSTFQTYAEGTNIATQITNITTSISNEVTRATTAEGLLAPKANPAFTGVLTVPLLKITAGVPGIGKVLTSDADGDATWETPAAGSTVTIDAVPTDASNNAVSSNGVFDALALKAPLASPTLTGTPAAPTATAGTNTTQIATTAFVTAGLSGKENTITSGTTAQYIRGDKSLATFPAIPTNADYVDKTTAQTIAGIKTFSALSKYGSDLSATYDVRSFTDKGYVDTQIGTREPSISAGTTAQYYRGDKTWQPFPTIPSSTDFVDVTTGQTIAGVKTFSNKPTFIDTWANFQSTFGSIGQSGRIGFARSSDAAITVRLGFTSATENSAFDISNTAGSGSINMTVTGGTSFKMFSDGKIALQTGGTFTNTAEQLQVGGTVRADQFKISALNTAPASATATGALGEIRITATHIYVCTATNVWVRAALATW